MAAFKAVNELERLLVDAADDPAARPGFYRALPEHDLLAITEGPVPEQVQRATSSNETRLQLRTIEIDGRLLVPIFTSIERISAVVGTEVGFVAMKGRVLLDMLRDTDLVLNPGSDYGKFLTRQEVAEIVDGSIFAPRKTDVGGRRILLGQPTDYPRHITEALAGLFARHRAVKAAYLAHAFVQDIDEAPHTLVAVEVSGDWQRVVEEAVVVVREVAKCEEVVDFVRIGHGDDESIGAYMRRETKPFYRRKLFGLF